LKLQLRQYQENKYNMEKSMFKSVPVEDAVGMVLGHDVTQIIQGGFKGPAFKKGYVLKSEDIPRLLDMGKRHIFVLDLKEDFIHENEAAERIAMGASGSGIKFTSPSEGKVNLVAGYSGILKINVNALHQINTLEEIALATLHTDQQVTAGSQIAGARIIPLATGKEKIEKVEAICRENFPVISIKPFRSLKVGVITTGSEVYTGRITDKFGPVLREKFGELGCQILRQVFVPDEIDMTVGAIKDLIKEGAEFIALTGGMSVDPDDLTPAGIRAAGGEIVLYGAPVFPGAMFMLAHIGNVTLVGLPGCVMYHRASIFDLIVPRIVAGEKITRDDVTALGHGGYCSNCSECRYPVCGFGKA
jgi:molybdenum cofactor synthesis domain-containing protein